MDSCRRLVSSLRKALTRHSDKMCNTFTPIWYLCCVIGLNWMAHDHIFDYLYGADSLAASIARGLGWFMTGEMVLHWLFLCLVDSTYINTEENNAKRLEHEKTNPQFASEGIAYGELKERRPTLGTGHWSVITHYIGADVKRTAYPYWGWKPCIVCSCHKPPRCHHCPVCNVCVLKRDHHCFFARQCVGLNNQRYFVVFNFWACLLTMFAIPQLVIYTFSTAWDSMSAPDLFLPWTVISCLIGWTDVYTLVLVSQNWSMIYFLLSAAFFLIEQVKCIDEGKTSYELEHKNHLIHCQYKSRYDRFTCVFGRNNIWINFLIPYHWASKPSDDGLTWSSMKME